MFAEQDAKYHDIGPAVMVADKQIPVLFTQTIKALYIPFKPGIKAQQPRQSFTPAVHHEIAKNGYRAPDRRNGHKKFNQPGDDDWHGADDGDYDSQGDTQRERYRGE